MSLPKEPPLGLLISMAIRYDHALGCPGYYDQEIYRMQSRPTLSHKQRFDATIITMRQLYEEVAGYGFYSPDKEEYYKQFLK